MIKNNLICAYAAFNCGKNETEGFFESLILEKLVKKEQRVVLTFQESISRHQQLKILLIVFRGIYHT